MGIRNLVEVFRLLDSAKRPDHRVERDSSRDQCKALGEPPSQGGAAARLYGDRTSGWGVDEAGKTELLTQLSRKHSKQPALVFILVVCLLFVL